MIQTIGQPVSAVSSASGQSASSADYDSFLRNKVRLAERKGFEIDAAEINPAAKGHQAAIIRWMADGGCRACFAAFGLGKTVIELEVARLMVEKIGNGQQATGNGQQATGNRPVRALIILPLGVRQEFKRDAVKILGWSEPPFFVRRLDEVLAREAGQSAIRNPQSAIYLTNYESVRDGKLDPADFSVVVLDEASVLRGFGGTKTFRELMLLCTGDGGPTGRYRTKRVPYRFVATATPAPNEYIELLAYAEFLGIMDISQAKTRFFKRDSTHADCLTLHPHKEREFWLWVASWAIFVQKPSDLGFSDEGYALPEMEVFWHEVPTDHTDAGTTKSGQHKLFRNAAIGVQDAAAEKRISLPARIAKMMELRRMAPGEHRLLWHDLEAERHAIEKALSGQRDSGPGTRDQAFGSETQVPSPKCLVPFASVYGSQDLDEREKAIIDFSDGRIRELAAKPCIAGSGCNFQRHCSWAIFLGIGFKFNDFIQAVHRIHRFMQTRKVRIDLIYTEAEGEVRKQLERKWRQHEEMVQKMTDIIREFGLSHAAMAAALGRKMGVERVEASDGDPATGKPAHYRLVNNDCVPETKAMPESSVHLVLTSIPFATQYEYSPNYADFGHSDGNDEFFRQMDFLTPELLRVLAPGRVAAIHVKDRIVPGGMTNLGFQTVYPFHCRCIDHYTRHGFAYMGMITVVTDVVRENNQTYRLGWSRQCTDATCMGVGMPEYILLFRKPQTDRSASYADQPVRKTKAAYSRSRWQVDAHGFWRSGGDRCLSSEELRDLPHDQIFRWFRQYSLSRVYDLDHHVKTCEQVERHGRLPTTFMLLQPQSWAPEVWSDVARMLTLNSSQHQKGRQMHLCPLQFDICDRLITRFTMPSETVYDPFGGIMTVPFRAVKLGRFGVGCELSSAYFLDGCTYCRAAAAELEMPSLFDLPGTKEEAEETASSTDCTDSAEAEEAEEKKESMA